jgi:WD40 repeat protein
MNFAKARETADKAYFNQTNRHLSEVDVLILRGSWDDKTYDAMETHRYAKNYLKGDAGPKLWKALSKALGEKVSKRNFRTALARWADKEGRTSKSDKDNNKGRRDDVQEELKSAPLADNFDAGKAKVSNVSTTYDWGEAPDTYRFFGRDRELEKLKQWIFDENCRVIALLGMRGVGKTRMAIKLGLEGHLNESTKEFDYVIWRSLLSTPPFQDVISDLIASVSRRDRNDISGSEEEKIAIFLECLRNHKCLLILDNVESILTSGNVAGEYLDGYSAYGHLIKKIGEIKHQSCLILTSREKPKEIALLEGKERPVRSFNLSGLNVSAGQKIFDEIGSFSGSFSGSRSNWSRLIELYDGNPLALELVAKHIDQVFSRDISRFLEEERPIFSNLRTLLKWHFDRLSEEEREVIYWLAINYEPTSLSDLRRDIVSPVNSEKTVDTLQSLQMRIPVETRPVASFTIQPVLIEYATERLLEEAFLEFTNERFFLLNQYALSKATSKEYIRQGQLRRFVSPLLRRLVDSLGSKKRTEKKLKYILSQWREKNSRKPGYLGGNILTMLQELNDKNLDEYDLSELSIWQANLQGTNLHKVDFSNSDFRRTKFTNTLNIVLSVDFNSDGRAVVTGDSDHNVNVWNVDDGQLLKSFSEHSDWVWSTKFSPDGRTIASGSDDCTVKIWDLDSGNCKVTLKHETWVRAIAYDPTGVTLASGSDDGIVRIWDLQNSKLLCALEGHESRVLSVEFGINGEHLLSCSDDGTLRTWDLGKEPKCKLVMPAHRGKVQDASFSPDGKTIASGSSDGIVSIWDAQSGLLLKNFDLDGQAVWSVSYSSDSKSIIVGSDSPTIKMYSLVTGEIIRQFFGHKDRVWSIASSRDGLLLASGSHDKTMKLWKIDTAACLQTFQGQVDKVWAIGFSPNGKVIASGSEDFYVRIWRIDITNGDNRDCIRSFREKSSWVWSVAFHPNDPILATGGDNKTVSLWDYRNGSLIASLEGHDNWVRTVSFSPCGSLLASGGDDNSVIVWDIKTLARSQILSGHAACVRSVEFSPDGSRLGSSSDDGTVRIWDYKKGQCVNIFNEHTNRVRSISFSPDGSLLASGSDDNTIKLWNLANGNCVATLSDHKDIVCSVTFGADNHILISGSDDNTVKVWNITDNSCLSTLKGHTGWVRSVAFNHVRQIIASSSQDGSIMLWDYKTFKRYRTLQIPAPYEGMKISGATGINSVQRESLRALGAVISG